MSVGRCVSFAGGLGLLVATYFSDAPKHETHIRDERPASVETKAPVLEETRPVGLTLYEKLAIAIQEPENQKVFLEADREQRETGCETGGKWIELDGKLFARKIPNRFAQGRYMVAEYAQGNRQRAGELSNQIETAVSVCLYNQEMHDVGYNNDIFPMVMQRQSNCVYPVLHPYPFARRVRLLAIQPLRQDEMPGLFMLFSQVNTLVYSPEPDALDAVCREGRVVAGFHIHPHARKSSVSWLPQASKVDREHSHNIPEMIQVREEGVLKFSYLEGGNERPLGELR